MHPCEARSLSRRMAPRDVAVITTATGFHKAEGECLESEAGLNGC